MDEEYPDDRAGEEIYAERERARAPVTADREPAAEPLPADGLPPTGDDRVDAAMAELGRLPGAPPEEHVAVLEEVHGQLRDILGELGESEPDQEQR